MITTLAGSLTMFAGLYLWLDADARTARIQTRCVQGSGETWLCPESVHADLDRTHTEYNFGVAGTGAGAVLITLGAYLWMHNEPPATTAFVGPNGVMVRGQF
jgi:hypothetical protein